MHNLWGIICKWKFWGPLGFKKDALENLSQTKLFKCTMGFYRGEARFLLMQVASSEKWGKFYWHKVQLFVQGNLFVLKTKIVFISQCKHSLNYKQTKWPPSCWLIPESSWNIKWALGEFCMRQLIPNKEKKRKRKKDLCPGAKQTKYMYFKINILRGKFCIQNSAFND